MSKGDALRRVNLPRIKIMAPFRDCEQPSVPSSLDFMPDVNKWIAKNTSIVFRIETRLPFYVGSTFALVRLKFWRLSSFPGGNRASFRTGRAGGSSLSVGLRFCLPTGNGRLHKRDGSQAYQGSKSQRCEQIRRARYLRHVPLTECRCRARDKSPLPSTRRLPLEAASALPGRP